MKSQVPVAIQPLIDAYLKALKPFSTHFYGIYIYGSVALGAFEEQESDIDIVVLTQGEWTLRELKQLEAVHTQLLREQPLSKRLDVLYLPLHELGKISKIAPHPIMRDGKFVLAAHGDLNAVTRWITKHNGIRLLGPDPSKLPIKVTWEDVLATMRYNLERYWASKIRRPYLFLFDFWVVFAVTTLCRVLTTIEEGEIIAKSPALKRWRDRLPERWRPLIDEIMRIRYHANTPSLYRSRMKRASDTLAFIKYVQKRGREKLNAM